jgi:hypothetical protein
MTYPRYRNGYEDDGSLITSGNRRDRCPNCGSSRYRETISREHCDACGLEMDYWGGGGNAVYESHLAREAAREAARQDEIRKIEETDELDEW